MNFGIKFHFFKIKIFDHSLQKTNSPLFIERKNNQTKYQEKSSYKIIFVNAEVLEHQILLILVFVLAKEVSKKIGLG